VGDTEINGLEYRFNYNNNVNTFANEYSAYLSMFGIDLKKSLKKQEYSEGKTWAQNFIESTTPQLVEVAILEAEGKKSGFTMTEEQTKGIDDYFTDLENYAKAEKLPVNVFVIRNYGTGMTVNDIRSFMERRIYSAAYQEKVVDEINVTDEQKQTYYNEHKSDFDTADIRSFTFKYTAPEAKTDEDGNTIETTDESYKDEARAKAEALLTAATDEATFASAAFETLTAEEKETYKDQDITLNNDVKSSSLGTEVAKWIFDSARVEGDKTVIDENNAFNVIYFKRAGLKEYNAVSVRHILFTGETDEVKQKAEALLKQWQEGEATEESFTALVKDNSEDTGSVENGGLYSDIGKGQMQVEFNNWIFDPVRKPGDTGIVKTSYGYHVMYFSGVGGPYWKIEAENKVKSEEYTKYLDELKKSYTTVENKDIIVMSAENIIK
ncbi:MAG: putative isomerase, partial [Clostridia bacterium]|nr:putative isomerase [Clostridia bacterium]